MIKSLSDNVEIPSCPVITFLKIPKGPACWTHTCGRGVGGVCVCVAVLWSPERTRWQVLNGWNIWFGNSFFFTILMSEIVPRVFFFCHCAKSVDGKRDSQNVNVSIWNESSRLKEFQQALLVWAWRMQCTLFFSYPAWLMYSTHCTRIYFCHLKRMRVPHYMMYAPQKNISFLVIGLLQNWCGDTFFKFIYFLFLYFLQIFFGELVKYTCDTCTWLLEPDQISHTQSMVAKRGPTNRANVYIVSVHVHVYMCMYVKTSFKTQHSRSPIDPAILPAIGHRFIAIVL